MTSDATIHSTTCGSYVVTIENGRKRHRTFNCRSLAEAYEVLRGRRIRQAVLAQSVAYDEMVGLPDGADTSYMPVTVPPR